MYNFPQFPPDPGSLWPVRIAWIAAAIFCLVVWASIILGFLEGM